MTRILIISLILILGNNYVSTRIIEGDIIVGEDIKDENFVKRGLVRNYNQWPNGVVPYKISSEYSAENKKLLISAMDLITRKTGRCITFVEKDQRHSNYINIVNGKLCSSSIGMGSGGQTLNINIQQCMYLGTIVHEICHALGFLHEQNRPDRDNHVTIAYDNIYEQYWPNFNKYSGYETFGLPYDYYSIMHYQGNAFAKNYKMPTIIPKVADVELLSSSRKTEAQILSYYDIRTLTKLYRCPDITTTTPGPTTPQTGITFTVENNYDTNMYLYKFSAGEYNFQKTIIPKASFTVVNENKGEKFELKTFDRTQKKWLSGFFTIGQGSFSSSGVTVLVQYVFNPTTTKSTTTTSTTTKSTTKNTPKVTTSTTTIAIKPSSTAQASKSSTTSKAYKPSTSPTPQELVQEKNTRITFSNLASVISANSGPKVRTIIYGQDVSGLENEVNAFFERQMMINGYTSVSTSYNWTRVIEIATNKQKLVMNAVVDFKLITVDNATDNNTNGSSKKLVATILNNFVNGPVQGKLIAAAPEGSTVVPVKNISLISSEIKISLTFVNQSKLSTTKAIGVTTRQPLCAKSFTLRIRNNFPEYPIRIFKYNAATKLETLTGFIYERETFEMKGKCGETFRMYHRTDMNEFQLCSGKFRISKRIIRAHCLNWYPSESLS